MTNRKSHTRYRLVPKSMTLDDLERPFRTLFQNACVFGAHHSALEVSHFMRYTYLRLTYLLTPRKFE